MFHLWRLIVVAVLLSTVEDAEGSSCVLSEGRCEFTKVNSLLSEASDLISKAQQYASPCGSICSRFPVDCSELLLCGQNKSGVYRVWPLSRALPGINAVLVYCDMTTDGGGWTVIQRRGNYGRPNNYFFQDWKHYKEGFGNLLKDFWLGNDYIYALTNQKKTSIRFDLKNEEESRYALYDHFWIDNEAYNYTMHVEDYSGTAGDSFINRHNGMKFSTKDRDNDGTGQDCAAIYKGGWWYDGCLASNLNGLYLNGKHESYADGIEWSSWTGLYYSLIETEMKIRPVNFIPTTEETLSSLTPMK